MKRLSFRYYLERRARGEPDLRPMLVAPDDPVLDASSWADIMRHLKAQDADDKYIMQLRRLWTEYGHAAITLDRKRAERSNVRFPPIADI